MLSTIFIISVNIEEETRGQILHGNGNVCVVNKKTIQPQALVDKSVISIVNTIRKIHPNIPKHTQGSDEQQRTWNNIPAATESYHNLHKRPSRSFSLLCHHSCRARFPRAGRNQSPLTESFVSFRSVSLDINLPRNSTLVIATGFEIPILSSNFDSYLVN